MHDDVLRVLLIEDDGPEPLPIDLLALGASGFGPFAVEACAGMAQAGGVLGGHWFDAVMPRAASTAAPVATRAREKEKGIRRMGRAGR